MCKHGLSTKQQSISFHLFVWCLRSIIFLKYFLPNSDSHDEPPSSNWPVLGSLLAPKRLIRGMSDTNIGPWYKRTPTPCWPVRNGPAKSRMGQIEGGFTLSQKENEK